ncbi:DUF4212 domain-containing protein [Rhodomicrobium vannielii ATCC 17100]|uniref:DUF4212 domain-containing protein n=1 Tax=Rhodomicrobium udaipurense TaxID=1202716 RepID=A0A8I1GH19_9HYPH|nr:MULTISPECIES: DUF4212 domain-containing protein [Rhodomicrobium]MBJ7535583.1 DUF4212 domain-containing protein [Rhodomicrobium vannielii ATCC 17100]MBJ7544709.1 DUF4212 domain-containing protein [Rhodomicrobium udaipurense]
MSDDDVKQAYWRSISRISLGMTVTLAVIMIVFPFFIPELNAYRFLRFPLGYFLLAHGTVILLAILIYGFFGGQQRADRVHNMTIQF